MKYRRAHLTASLAAALLVLVTASPAFGASVCPSFLQPEEEIHTDGRVIATARSRIWKEKDFWQKRAEEERRLARTDDPVERAELHLEFARRRMETFQRLRSEGRYCFVLLDLYRDSIYGGLGELRYAQHLGAHSGRVREVFESIRSSLQNYQDALRVVQEEVSGEGPSWRTQGTSSEKVVGDHIKFAEQRLRNWSRGNWRILEPIK